MNMEFINAPCRYCFRVESDHLYSEKKCLFAASKYRAIPRTQGFWDYFVKHCRARDQIEPVQLRVKWTGEFTAALSYHLEGRCLGDIRWYGGGAWFWFGESDLQRCLEITDASRSAS